MKRVSRRQRMEEKERSEKNEIMWKANTQVKKVTSMRMNIESNGFKVNAWIDVQAHSKYFVKDLS